MKLDNPFNAPVYYVESTPTTMLEIRNINELVHGTVLAAGFQSAGKGRITGRTWLGAKEVNVYFSLFLDAGMLPFPVMSLSARTAFALVAFLESEYQIQAKVKWPNDVLVEGKKISGILLEVKGSEVVLGCGINCLQTEFDDFRTNATSLKLVNGTIDKPLMVLEKFLGYVHKEFALPQSMAERSALIYNYGKEIKIKTGHPESGEIISGVIMGLNEDGSLRLDTGTNIKSIYSGEIIRE